MEQDVQLVEKPFPAPGPIERHVHLPVQRAESKRIGIAHTGLNVGGGINLCVGQVRHRRAHGQGLEGEAQLSISSRSSWLISLTRQHLSLSMVTNTITSRCRIASRTAEGAPSDFTFLLR